MVVRASSMDLNSCAFSICAVMLPIARYGFCSECTMIVVAVGTVYFSILAPQYSAPAARNDYGTGVPCGNSKTVFVYDGRMLRDGIRLERRFREGICASRCATGAFRVRHQAGNHCRGQHRRGGGCIHRRRQETGGGVGTLHEQGVPEFYGFYPFARRFHEPR